MKNITITILSTLLLITGGYLLYDKVLMEEDNSTINNNESQEIIRNNSNYTIEFFEGEMYGGIDVGGNYDGATHLYLWENGTYLFDKRKENGDYKIEEASLGRYKVVGDEIHLDYIFEINQGKDVKSNQDDYLTISNKTKIFKITPHSSNFYDGTFAHEFDLKSNDITLTHIDQSPYEGLDGDKEISNIFYNQLKFYLNNME